MKATTKQFMECMDKLFSAYAKDGVMDDYRMEENVFYTSNKDDASYMWAAVDGALHLFNSLCGTTLKSDSADDRVIIEE